MKLRKAAAAAALAAVMCLTSCGEQEVTDIGGAVNISFSWWGKDIRHSYTVSAIKDFVTQNPEIDVMTEYGEFEAFQNRMDVVYSAHNECDVMQINYDWLYRFSPDGKGFYDLNELSDYIDLDNFTQEQLSYGMINGRLNGISNALNTETCFYNKEIYDRYGLPLPTDWDGLFEAAELMSADGIYPLELSRKAAWLSIIAYEEQLSGRQMFDSSGALGFTQENFADMINFYKRLIDGKVTKFYNDDNKYDFANGVSAGYLCWISDASYYCDPLIKSGMKIVIGEYPRTEGSKLSGWYAKPTSMYCIRRDTEQPEAAAKLVNFLLNNHDMAKRQGLEKGIPLSKSMLEVLEANDMLTGVQRVANDKLAASPDIGVMSPYLESAALMEVFDDAAIGVLYNDGSAEEFAARMYETASAVSVGTADPNK